MQHVALHRRSSLAALAAAMMAIACAGCDRLPLDLGDRHDAGVESDAGVDPDAGLPPPDDQPPIFVRELALGTDFGCALLTDGTAACWGSNHFGQLGVDETISLLPQCGEGTCVTSPTPNLHFANLDSLGAGDGFVCVRSTLGAVRCLGSHRFGEQGDFTHPAEGRHPDPSFVGDSGWALEVAVGRHHACALAPDHTVLCWGLGEHGQLGRIAPQRCPVPAGMHAQLGVSESTRDVACATGPAPVEGLTGPVDHIVAGDFHTCAMQSGQILCWGRDDRGQLGDGEPGEGRATPAPVGAAGFPLSGASQLALGDGTSVALQVTGTTARWGDATGGALALPPADAEACGSWRCASTPRVGEPLLTQVALGHRFGCGLNLIGQVHCWGLADEGRLGADLAMVRTTTCSSETGEVPCAPDPVPVDRLDFGVRSIVVGDAHACALVYAVDEGASSVLCWGRNDKGQLGIGRLGGFEPTPVAIPGTR